MGVRLQAVPEPSEVRNVIADHGPHCAQLMWSPMRERSYSSRKPARVGKLYAPAQQVTRRAVPGTADLHGDGRAQRSSHRWHAQATRQSTIGVPAACPGTRTPVPNRPTLHTLGRCATAAAHAGSDAATTRAGRIRAVVVTTDRGWSSGAAG